jgi:hypothetical protein
MSDVSDTRKLYGREWRTVPLIFKGLYDPKKEPEAEIIRAEFQEKFSLILGTLSREEKADNDRYLGVVSEILKVNPKVGFIYSGHAPRQNIHAYFEREGVNKQCIFVGWVDTKVYAQVLDIFLSTWPMGSGLTIFESLVAKKPLVHFFGDGTVMDWIEQDIINSGEVDLGKFSRYKSLIKGAVSDQEYIDHVQQLIDSPERRNDEGIIGKQFADEYLSDLSRLGRIMVKQILSIIDEKTKTSGR